MKYNFKFYKVCSFVGFIFLLLISSCDKKERIYKEELAISNSPTEEINPGKENMVDIKPLVENSYFLTVCGEYNDALDYVKVPEMSDAYITQDDFLIFIGNTARKGLDINWRNEEASNIICKYHPSGSLIWEKSVKIQGEPYMEMDIEEQKYHHITEDRNGNIYISGHIYFKNHYEDYSGSSMFIMKLDKNGNVLWIKKYVAALTMFFRSQLMVSDNSVTMIVENFGEGISLFALYKLDLNGEVIFNKYYTIGHGFYFYSATILSDGSVILAGCNFQYIPYRRERMFCVKIDSNGEIVWCIKNGSWSSELSFSFKSVYESPGGALIFAGIKKGNTYNDYEKNSIIVLKVENGVAEYLNDFTVKNILLKDVVGMFENDDGSLIIACQGLNIVKMKKQPLFIKFNKNGHHEIWKYEKPCENELFFFNKYYDYFVIGINSFTKREEGFSSESQSEFDNIAAQFIFIKEPQILCSRSPISANSFIEYFSYDSSGLENKHIPSLKTYMLEYVIGESSIEFYRKALWDAEYEGLKWLREHSLDNFWYNSGALNIKSVVLNDSKVNFRTGPYLDSEVIGMLNYGTEVEVINRGSFRVPIQGMNDFWYKVKISDSSKGWVYGHFLDFIYEHPGLGELPR